MDFPTDGHPGRLQDKIAIVTGGSMGLGEGIVRKFVHEGAKVVIFDINRKAGEQVIATLPDGKVEVFEGDVTKEEDWTTALEVAKSCFGNLHIVVNNAGVVHRAGPSPEVPPSEFHRIMNINIAPLYHSAKTISPHFKSQETGGGGVFINISSISAPRPRPNLVWYAGSKGAVSSITRGLAAEFAPYGIRCNAVLPVVADTGMVASVLGGADSEEGRRRLVAQIPLGRICRPEDVGSAVCFLASDEAAFITGVELPVDGGRALM
ncbi:4-formylbenzenesulfonate dehydrogenase 1 2 [Lecanosticta acicola]|uniref:4-formylbenzenesulfonate dehydrogenase 1 2 n=1 Tax=Lecanosticta acicola TaxID=111012 RepID=A0AAI8VVA0_9PEZI|nr:4-formylbenzenesulfonate dehydrogenase 1 2 [Lecanosticta acicola]